MVIEVDGRGGGYLEEADGIARAVTPGRGKERIMSRFSAARRRARPILAAPFVLALLLAAPPDRDAFADHTTLHSLAQGILLAATNRCKAAWSNTTAAQKCTGGSVEAEHDASTNTFNCRIEKTCRYGSFNEHKRDTSITVGLEYLESGGVLRNCRGDIQARECNQYGL